MKRTVKLKNAFGTTKGIIVTGALIGLTAALLQKWGNPANMGICVACFTRDIAGAVGLHRAGPVQYVRPEIIGFILGSTVAALAFREFRARGGSAPLVRFILGAFAMVGALVFLGCPWRAFLRLAGGDLNAVLGIAGLAFGVFIGTRFLAKGYTLGRAEKTYAAAGRLFPLMALGLLIVMFLCPQPDPAGAGESVKSLKSGVLFYSIVAPGSMHAPLVLSLLAGLFIGFIAQRSRFCTMGSLRDLILFGEKHLFRGVVALTVAAFLLNLVMGQVKFGFAGQPAAHTKHFWNFAGMALAGLAFCLAGGCPGRQLFMAGEGDGDAAVFALGMLTGAAFAHNFGLASTGKGLGPHGVAAVVVGFIVCLFIGSTLREKTV